MIVHEVSQNTPEWHLLRAGKPTASAFSNLVTSTGAQSKSLEKYALTLAAEKFAGGQVDAWEGNYHTERGHALEADALAAYGLIYDAEISRVGFVTDDKETMGCSPDALVGDDGTVEIKCLKAENHIAAILYHRKHGKAPVDYYQQTQGQVMLTERKWCDLCFYHPVLPMLVVRDTANLDFHMSLTRAIAEVIRQRDEAIKVLESI